MKHLISFILIFVIIITSVFVISINIFAENPESTSITKDSIYGFSYPGTDKNYPDTYADTLSNGVYYSDTLDEKEVIGFTLPDSSYTYNKTAKHFYITMDLRTYCDVSYIAASFVDINNSVYPIKVEFFASFDGYSFDYLGEGKKLSVKTHSTEIGISDGITRRIKMVKAVIYTDLESLVCIDEFCVKGIQNNKSVIVSQGCSSSFSSAAKLNNLKAVNYQNGDLDLDFDSDINSQLSAFATISPSVNSAKMHVTQTLDLKTVKDINEICVTLGSYSLPNTIEVYTSVDGQNYLQYGNAYEYVKFGNSNVPLSKFRVNKPYTEKARYIKLNYIGTSDFLIKSVLVYGFTGEVCQTYLKSEDASSYSNIAEDASVEINGKKTDKLNDGVFPNINTGNGYDDFEYSRTDATNIKIDLKEKIDISGIGMEMLNHYSDLQIKIYTSNDDENYIYIGNMTYSQTVGLKQLYLGKSDEIKARYIKIEISNISYSGIYIGEIQVYSNGVLSPFIKGGFIDLPISNDTGSPYYLYQKYTQNDWEDLFYTMKSCGMSYAVIMNIADERTKKTIYPNPSVDGYSYLGTGDMAFSSPDQLDAILTAADKADINIFIGSVVNIDMFFGTINGLGNNEQNAYIDSYIKDGNGLYNDIISRYSAHKSFYGFYLSDETSDKWLNFGYGRGVELARKRYLGQASYLRENAPDKKILIAPAIWNTIGAGVSPETFANDLISLIEPENGIKPFDIISFQDCLARQEVTASAYERYEASLSAAVNALRGSGIEVWNDTEIFDYQYFGSKSFEEIIESLFTGTKYSDVSIVFDLIHYFYCNVGNYSDVRNFETDYILREYKKYYSNFKNDIALSSEYVMTDEFEHFGYLYNMTGGWQLESRLVEPITAISKNNSGEESITYKLNGNVSNVKMTVYQLSETPDAINNYLKIYISKDGTQFKNTGFDIESLDEQGNGLQKGIIVSDIPNENIGYIKIVLSRYSSGYN